MADLQSVFAEAAKLDKSITQLLKLSTYSEYGDLSGLDIDYADGEQIFLRDELNGIIDSLASAQERIAHLSRPIVEESRLRKGTAEKYRTRKGHFYDCGSIIEALVSDGYRDVPYWTRTRVEHDGERYYLVGHKDVSMNGLLVRVRSST